MLRRTFLYLARLSATAEFYCLAEFLDVLAGWLELSSRDL